MYFLIYKPYLMLSQFSREGDKPTLADLEYDFPKDVYPVGRLDADSEGLLLLTSDKQLNHRLLNPKFRHNRTYYVQVEGALTDEACQQLSRGYYFGGWQILRYLTRHARLFPNRSFRNESRPSGTGPIFPLPGYPFRCMKAKIGRCAK